MIRLANQSTEQTKLTLLVWQNLIALFRRNAVQILRAAGKPTDNYFEAQYVMAAFADDVFIHLDWEGRRAWTSNLLESTLFQSHVAGEMFFEKLDRLLRDRDPADKSLAAVYLTALSLGFRGKYHGINDHGKLRRYRNELFNFIFRQPADLVNEAKVAFPDSYVQNLQKEKSKKLMNPRVWLAVLGVVLFTYLAVSHGLWMRLTSRHRACQPTDCRNGETAGFAATATELTFAKLTMSSFTVLLILIAILLLLVGTAIFLFLVIRRSRKISFTADASAKAEKARKILRHRVSAICVGRRTPFIFPARTPNSENLRHRPRLSLSRAVVPAGG